MELRTSDFYYDLPEELIAQTPVEPRDSSRMLVYDRKTGEMRHDKHFYDIVDYFTKGDILVINDTKVLPARIYGAKKTGVVEKNGLFVPYLEYKFSKDSVTSINIGPTFDENIFYTSTNRMLLNFGYKGIEVNRSKIPLRY